MTIYCEFDGVKHWYKVYRADDKVIVFQCRYCEGFKHIPKAGFYYALTGRRLSTQQILERNRKAYREEMNRSFLDFIPEPIKSDEPYAFPWRLIPTRLRKLIEKYGVTFGKYAYDDPDRALG